MKTKTSPKVIQTESPAISSTTWSDAANEACHRMAPLWPLQSFVAVNPFTGLTNKPFNEVCALFEKIIPGGMLMPGDYYLAKLAEGVITDSNLSNAIAASGGGHPGSKWTPQGIREALVAGADAKPSSLPTVAEWIDAEQNEDWQISITEEISQFCAGYYDNGQSTWRMPWAHLPLFTAWKEQTQLDSSLERHGLTGFGESVAALPDSAEDAIIMLMHHIDSMINPVDFLHKQLLSIRGWAGYVQYLVREQSMQGGSDDSLLQLLAIRLAYDVELLNRLSAQAYLQSWNEADRADASSWPARWLCQIAHEKVWQNQVHTKLLGHSKVVSAPTRPSTQAVFCIDVRSETFRRSLESVAPSVETFGFAGFFGMPIESIPFGRNQGTAQCPVLLTPSYSVGEALSGADKKTTHLALERLHQSKRLNLSWNAFKTSAVSCFSFVEITGLGFAAKLFRDAFAPGNSSKTSPTNSVPCLDHDEDLQTGISMLDRVALAKGALKNLGLTRDFARIVLLCGHGSKTKNNPYAAGLDCGACGGHSGEPNARIAAMILNDPHVRKALSKDGVEIPDDTWFLAGLHNTTTDDVTLLDLSACPASHQDDIVALQTQLENAAVAARKARAKSLGLDPASPDLDKQVAARSIDWSQVRPEWGLAGNAAFIAAPRGRTRGLDLEGRVFLHSYDHHHDKEKSTLELILCAPMVVANWINLQYFASTANNEAFGSGNKTIHNVVGTLGVMSGNSGDLQTGLPLQSVHDGDHWMHEPLRLHVYIEAPESDIDAVIAKHANVRELVENGWLLLFSLGEEGQTIRQRHTDGQWIPAIIS